VVAAVRSSQSIPVNSGGILKKGIGRFSRHRRGSGLVELFRLG